MIKINIPSWLGQPKPRLRIDAYVDGEPFDLGKLYAEPGDVLEIGIEEGDTGKRLRFEFREVK